MLRFFRFFVVVAVLMGILTWSGVFHSPRLAGVWTETAYHYSPTENLERIDVLQLQQARAHLDIAMYAFTDRAVAEELVRLADLGIAIRIYRDGEQYREEESRGNSTTDLFMGHPNIQVRIKPPSKQNLMHLKAYSDGDTLRDGSANFSFSGLCKQDNSLTITNSRDKIQEFESVFDEMWQRQNNLVAQ